MDGHTAPQASHDWEALKSKGPFRVVIADPPWDYYGSPDKWAAAGKFYPLMTDQELSQISVPNVLAKKAIVFMWCTSSSLARAIDLLSAWKLHYRGVAFVWCKTSKSGRPIGAQGVRPSITKPLTEFVIAGSTQIKGRPLPLYNEAVKQTIFAPKGKHSEKPEEVQSSIESMYPDEPKAELFARRHRVGWSCWGNELSTKQDILSGIDLPTHLPLAAKTRISKSV